MLASKRTMEARPNPTTVPFMSAKPSLGCNSKNPPLILASYIGERNHVTRCSDCTLEWQAWGDVVVKKPGDGFNDFKSNA
jgi:hypothetical protein